MTGWLSAPYVRGLVAGAYDHEYTVTGTAEWTYARRDVRLPEHGWKLHVSSRAGDLAELAAVLVPYLLEARHDFKLAAGTSVLATMNQGWEHPATVGKAFTIYPEPGRVRELGLALAGLLRGRAGPRVLSDRRVAPDAPVYYRYGPFVNQWFAGERGVMAVQIPGPDGARFGAIAGLHYRQPDWVTDPFGHDTAAPELLGGRYVVDGGIMRSAHGDVFRGRDTVTGGRVVIKQARAYVGDAGDGADARTRLRNERRVLGALDGVGGVPRFVDHFAHGADEFLVSTDVGAENLQTRILTTGALGLSPAFGRLARDLARLVRALHDRDVIMRDVTPRNVVGAGLVDFGISALHGLHPRGGTHGFAPSRQMRGEPARPEDDAHALGMTLAFAATGLVPVIVETEDGLSAARMRSSLTALFGREAGFLHDLISGDGPVALAALRALTTAPIKTSTSGYGRRPCPDVPALRRHVLRIIRAEAPRRVLDAPVSAYASFDATIYTGSAGLGLELLHHGVPELVGDLLGHAVRARERPPGLYLGSTGTLLFRARMGDPVAADRPFDDADPHDDIISGIAGCGIGHLLRGDTASARTCVDALLTAGPMRLSVTGTPTASTEPAFSYSHGTAGVLDLLLEYVAATGDPAVRHEARHRADLLALTAADLIVRARRPGAVPLAVSWCQGLSGIGRALLHADSVFGDARYPDLALAAAEVCTEWVPRMQNPGQCCGLAGVGTYLIDCARHTGDVRWLDAAHDVARQLLRRSHGPDDAPRFVDLDRQDAPLSWSSGYTGILTFLRRLDDPAAPDLLS
ncbi:tRNA A-37 threonylcarbamoyl transferase component Bud32 [Catenuloplanes nepalensis]|uniref:tRNA A-37 threonylcarbamoyl transferase component Bud32 n=1 Tax=Catenuloplanes nepalensis TaxID=587533 RepID=A0ABT9MR84_9ACTN|nr:lanthionine synthetase LanC family protein [Catenuloplanes nepalensis]MDP9793943.1 tRNA A-37 threonylcarbamoyl transferase component Bud32 [Catenuloplanes nepalensis]